MENNNKTFDELFAELDAAIEAQNKAEEARRKAEELKSELQRRAQEEYDEQVNRARDEKRRRDEELGNVGINRDEQKPTGAKKTSKFRSAIAGFLAGVTLLTCGHFIGAGIKSSTKKNDAPKNDDKETTDTVLENNGRYVYDEKNNTYTINEEYEELTSDKFDKLATDYTLYLRNNGISDKISTSDIIKYVAVANIDKLSEDNKELLVSLVGNQTSEEFLNDAAKVIGEVAMHNYLIYKDEKTADNFIEVAPAIFGDQKERAAMTDSYVKQVATANNDATKMNSIVLKFITESNEGELSKLDDGVGFAMQFNIELMISTVSNNNLNKENLDMLIQLSTAEKYVSNIFAVIKGCNTNSKTLVK